MFVNNNCFNDALYWYQKKIGSYDQQQWEKSVEERVLNGIQLNVAKKVTKLKTELIDLDLIRGSAFNKAKPKQSWFTTTYYGIVKVICLPFYLRWWIEQTNKIICFILFTLYILQLSAMFIYLNHDQINDKKFLTIPISEVLTPIFMFFFLGTVHSQISASSNNHSSRNKSYLKPKLNTCKNLKEEPKKKLEKNNKSNLFKVNMSDLNDKINASLNNNENLNLNSNSLNNVKKLKFKNNSCIKARPLNSRSTYSGKNDSIRKLIVNRCFSAKSINNNLNPILNKKFFKSIKSKESEFGADNVFSNDSNELISNNDCSVYSSINLNTDLNFILKNKKTLKLKNENKLHLNEQKKFLNDRIESNEKLFNLTDVKNNNLTNLTSNNKHSFEEHIYQPCKTKYYYFNELNNNDEKLIEQSKTCEENSTFSSNDSENGSISPTTPMKSLNDWPMINSDNSSEDDEEEDEDEQVEDEEINNMIKKQSKNILQQKECLSNKENIENLARSKITKNIYNLSSTKEDEISFLSNPKNDNSDKVSCTIYQQNEWRKLDLSILDISSILIRKVDLVKHNNEYFYLAIFFSLLFAFIPQLFRIQQTRSLIQNNALRFSSSFFEQNSNPFSYNNLNQKLKQTLHTSRCDNNERILQLFSNSKKNDRINESKLFYLHEKSLNQLNNEKNENHNQLQCQNLISNNASEEIVDFFNYFPVLVIDVLADTFKNSLYSWQMRFIVIVALILRFTLSLLFFFLLCVAERTFRERFLYAKYFCHLTSARRAKRNELPHFRLNKVRNIKSWLSIRSHLKKHGPQRSVDCIVSTSFILAVALLTFLCIQLLRESEICAGNLYCYEMVFWDLAIGIFIMRLIILGSKMNRKYRSNLSVLITEQINLYLQLEQKPHKKEELTLANNVLKLAADLLKQLEVPFKISGFSANPYLYNITKVIVLSAFSAVLSEVLGFKLKLYKIKLS